MSEFIFRESAPVRIGIGAFLLFALMCIPCAAQPAAQPGKSPKEQVAEAREKLHAAELAHPGNTVEVVEALDKLVGLMMDVEGASPESLELAKREIAAAEAAQGPRSKLYVSALGICADVHVTLGRPAEGRTFAERAFEIAQREFPGTTEFIEAADVLNFACGALGDLACALRAGEAAIAVERKIGHERERDLANTLSAVADVKDRMGDHAGAAVDYEEALSIYLHSYPNDPHVGAIENNLGVHYLQTQDIAKAISHFSRALDLNLRNYGPDAWQANDIYFDLAEAYTRNGEFPLAWKNFERSFANQRAYGGDPALAHFIFARSLASGGDLPRAVEEGLQSARIGRESFVLQARTLPERQALVYNDHRPQGLNIALSVLVRHPGTPPTDIYWEMVRSRALVAEEMARRQKNLNANSDPEVARLLKEMDQARADLLAAERTPPATQDNGEAILQATSRMEKIERELAEQSVDLRNDQRSNAVRLDDVRHGLPAHSVLISYVAYQRHAVEKVDPAHSKTAAYMAFVLKPDSETIRVYDLGDAKPIDGLVARARATADAEAHAGGLGAIRNERQWREAAGSLRQRVWDPLRVELDGASLALVVPDGALHLIPFSALPDGEGYLVEHGPVIHVLSSERDLVPAEGMRQKAGLLAIGNPAFEAAADGVFASRLRDAGISCQNLDKVGFHSLPGTAAEIDDVHAAWRHWNSGEPMSFETGALATRARFLAEAPHNRVLHLATHAFLLDSRCGDGNPLLRSGLVFAGGLGRESPILTAQQIASVDLSGVDWAVLSACDTGNGELHDGEGVLGLERAFRVAGARSVVMTLWPVDDDLTRQFMHELYAQRLGLHASTADAVRNAERKLLLARRAAGKSTHPWYWAGFVASGDWK
ncbi:MAG: CHAT domain-containing protein [Bryobacteraceae bacterium]